MWRHGRSDLKLGARLDCRRHANTRLGQNPLAGSGLYFRINSWATAGARLVLQQAPSGQLGPRAQYKAHRAALVIFLPAHFHSLPLQSLTLFPYTHWSHELSWTFKPATRLAFTSGRQCCPRSPKFHSGRSQVGDKRSASCPVSLIIISRNENSSVY